MVKAWLSAFRLRTLPLAIACIGLGGFLAASEGAFKWKIFLLTTLTALLLQILSNLANDLGDSQNGADSAERVGPQRAIQSGDISVRAMKIAIAIFTLAALFSGIYLLFLANIELKTFLIFLSLGLLAIVAALKYTMGNKPYGYHGLGDISVFIFFGLLAVIGSYYLHTSYINSWVFLPASACGLLAVGVLNINNIRDIEADALAGKITLAVRLGKKRAKIYHYLLLIVAIFLASIYIIFNYHSPWQWIFLITIPFLAINGRAVKNNQDSSRLDPFLKQMAISTVIFCMSFGLGQIL